MPKPISFYLSGATKAAVAPFLYALSFLIPRDKNRIVFGAWQGKLYSDNPKYFLLHVLEHTDLQVTWIGEQQVEDLLPKHKNLRFAVKDSPRAMWALLRAKTWIFCWGLFFDLTSYPLRGMAICINLWHGIPVKYVGRKSFNGRTNKFQDSFLGRLYACSMHLGGGWGYLSTASDLMTEMLADGVPHVFKRDKVIKCGSPRNDYLIHNASNTALIGELRKKYATILGFDSSKKIITYLPTHRNDGDFAWAFFNLDNPTQQKLKDLLDDHNAILIEKHHYLTLKNFPDVEPSLCAISIPAKDQSKIDIQELLLITDILICDYSSVYLDFFSLGRPIIHFAYDYKHFLELDSGMAFPLEDYAGGPIVYSLNDLFNALKRCIENPVIAPAKKCRELIAYETGHSCEQAIKFIHEVC